MSDLSTIEGCTAAIEAATMERPLDAYWLAECYAARAALYRDSVWAAWQACGRQEGRLSGLTRQFALYWEQDLAHAAEWERRAQEAINA
jgi:hypothetical protein